MDDHVRDSIKSGETSKVEDIVPEKQSSVLISEDSAILRAFKIVYLLFCFTSPYFYAWVALNGQENPQSLLISIIFETVFALNICINFLTDYVPDGEIIPEKDLGKIAERYLSTDFM